MKNAVPYVEIGTIVRSHGVKGDILVRTSSNKESSLDYLDCVYVHRRDVFEPFQVENRAWMPKGWKIRLAGTQTIEQADAFRELRLFAKKGDLRDPPSGEFYHHDLIGSRVESRSDSNFRGQIENIESLPAQDVWWVRTSGALIGVPAVSHFVKSVTGQCILMDNLNELL